LFILSFAILTLVSTKFRYLTNPETRPSMTDYILLSLCVLIILAYIFDLSSKYSKIPGVVLLIALGMGIQVVAGLTSFKIPNLRPVLPVLGTLGLVMIVMEASLDIQLSKSKKTMIVKSISAALLLLIVFTTSLTVFLAYFFNVPVRESLLNSIPLCIVSSAIAIPSAIGMDPFNKEFLVYESSFSDIFGIMLFDFILLGGSVGSGILAFARDGIFTIVIALISTGVLGYLLYKTTYHVNYVIILTFIILIYTLAKIIHLPALLLVLVFGMVLANNKLLETNFIKKYIDFRKFRNDISYFKKILCELTFLIRSFFFIMFGFYTSINDLFTFNNILISLLICSAMILLRWIFFRLALRLPAVPMVFFTPRGLITILLFLSIPEELRIPFISEQVVTLVILISIVFMAMGNVVRKKEMLESKMICTEKQDIAV
jgi:Kef-type K+ transport system membrane component KefB